MDALVCYRCGEFDGKGCACRDGITLLHGDCRTMPLSSWTIDAVITDPPYGIGLESHGQWFVRSDIEVRGDSDLVAAQFIADFCDHNRIPLAMFYSPFRPLGNWRSCLVWDKGEAVGVGGDRETCWKRTFELIGIAHNRELNGKRDGAVLRFGVRQQDFGFHPCQKPESLMTYLIIKLTSLSDLILDPYCGSGTTLRAAKSAGRKCIGIEIEEKYVQIAAERLRQSVLPFE